jgi:hypothetical protein
MHLQRSQNTDTCMWFRIRYNTTSEDEKNWIGTWYSDEIVYLVTSMKEMIILQEELQYNRKWLYSNT